MTEYTMSYAEMVDETLAGMADAVYEVNVANGWFEDERPFIGDIALLHSEVSEALEEYRTYHDVLTRWEVKRTVGGFTKGEVWALDEVHPLDIEDDPGAFKPVGVGSELADVLVRLLDTAKRYDVNLGEEFRRKLAFNATRGHKHGGKAI